MKVNDYDYNLPEKLIAQTPLENRSSSRLLVLDKETGNIEHKHFSDIIGIQEWVAVPCSRGSSKD